MSELHAIGVVGMHSLGQGVVQIGPVNLDIGRAILLQQAVAALAADQLLPRLIVLHCCVSGLHADLFQGIEHTQVLVNAGRIGRQREAGAHLTQLRRLFIDGHVNTGLLQSQGRRHPAHTRTDDCNAHNHSPSANNLTLTVSSFAMPEAGSRNPITTPWCAAAGMRRIGPLGGRRSFRA